MTALVDPFDARRVGRASGLLREFNEAGVLAAADVHVALRLCEIVEEADDAVALAVALAVRAPRIGHVHVNLATIRDTATVDADEPVDLSALPWPSGPAAGGGPSGGPGAGPAHARWTERVAASALVTVGEDAAVTTPLRLVGTWLYLDRYWREELRVAEDLRSLAARRPEGVRIDVLADGLARLFPGQTGHVMPAGARGVAPGDRGGRLTPAGAAGAGGVVPGDRAARLTPAGAAGVGRVAPGGRAQSLAAASAVLRAFAVVAGGPGTGKTTTVARIVALLCEQAAAAGRPAPLVALAAPTGKAAARLEEAVHEEAAGLAVTATVREELQALRASTLHRLLGWRPGSHSRFRHHRGQRLPHDVVIVDETSMVSLSLMARLVEAIRADARLILVGDPAQLASIEAGAVLGDIVGPAAGRLQIGPAERARLAEATGHPVDAEDPPPGAAVGDGIVVLTRVHRFGGGIARLAEAIRRGNGDAVLEVLADAPEGVTWIPGEAAEDALRAGIVSAARTVIDAGRAGLAREAIAALGTFRLLCAHRRGPDGVSTWTARIEGWLDVGGDHGWYAGRPLLVTENDYELRLYNGDTGVVVQSGPDRVSAAFERGGEILALSPSRLSAVDTAYAMTIHKSQGSQFDTAAVLLPAPTSRILTRELLYTAATRARQSLILAGSEEAIRIAVDRPVARASGLRGRLWGP